MIKNPKISVIIPAYNAEKTLRECLDSVLNQTYKNYEVIVVDNNSSDRTKEIIKEFQKKDRKIKYVFELKIGRGAARNVGERKAKGEIILMTDSDCIVPENWIKEMVKAIEKYDAVQGFEKAISDDFWNKYQYMNLVERFEKMEKNKVVKNKEILGKIDTKNFAIKKEIFEKIGFTSRKYISGNDTELSIKLARNNLRVRFLKDVKIKHFHPNSLKKVIEKQIYRAKWMVIISRDNKNFLKKTDFLRETNQTPWAFIKFFPGLIKTAILKGFAYTYYDFVVGISWRIGLIYGWLK